MTTEEITELGKYFLNLSGDRVKELLSIVVVNEKDIAELKEKIKTQYYTDQRIGNMSELDSDVKDDTVVGAINKSARIIDLQDYETLGSTIPTFNATFMYGQDIIPDVKTLVGKYSTGLASGIYVVFSCGHYQNGESYIGSIYLVFDADTRSLVARYDNPSTIPRYILDAFKEAVATESTNGLMASTDKAKLDNLTTDDVVSSTETDPETGKPKTLQEIIKELEASSGKLTIDSELSDTSENPVQNKVLAKILKFT